MRFFKSVFYCVLYTASLHAAQAAPPNVVLINADDLGWAEVGCYGQKKIKTPNIDKLASEGQRWAPRSAPPPAMC